MTKGCCVFTDNLWEIVLYFLDLGKRLDSFKPNYSLQDIAIYRAGYVRKDCSGRELGRGLCEGEVP